MKIAVVELFLLFQNNDNIFTVNRVFMSTLRYFWRSVSTSYMYTVYRQFYRSSFMYCIAGSEDFIRLPEKEERKETCLKFLTCLQQPFLQDIHAMRFHSPHLVLFYASCTERCICTPHVLQDEASNPICLLQPRTKIKKDENKTRKLRESN